MRTLGILGMCYIIVTPLTQRDFLKWGCQIVSPWGELKGSKPYTSWCVTGYNRIPCRNCPRQRLKANNDGEKFVKRCEGQLEMGSERQSGLHQLGSQ